MLPPSGSRQHHKSPVGRDLVDNRKVRATDINFQFSKCIPLYRVSFISPVMTETHPLEIHISFARFKERLDWFGSVSEGLEAAIPSLSPDLADLRPRSVRLETRTRRLLLGPVTVIIILNVLYQRVKATRE